MHHNFGGVAVPLLLLSTWNPSALASALLTCCQVTQRCCHLKRYFWSLKAVALKYLLLDVVSHFGLPNSWRWHTSFILPPANTEHLPPPVQKHRGCFRDEWIHIKSNSKCRYLGTASSHHLLKSPCISKPLVHTLLRSNSHHLHSRYPGHFTTPGALSTKSLLFTAVAEGNKHLIWYS